MRMEELHNGFQLSFELDLAGITVDEVLYEAEGALKVVLRDAAKTSTPDDYDRSAGNYLNYPLSDGTCPVIEALLPGPAGRIGIPVGSLNRTDGMHKVRILHNGTYFIIDVDERRDEDFPYEPLLWPENVPGEVKSPRVGNVSFVFHAPRGVVTHPDRPLEDFNAMYWTPADHNRWVGDVAITVWNDALHVFYLVDRRHHKSKGGRGGHWFEHIVSDDLIHWRELPAAVSMDENWEYIGTGTPFLMDGKYCLAYGLHSGRHGTAEELKKLGIPEGGTYAVSTDGVHFAKSGRIVIDDQNPSVYNRPDGLFGMGCGETLKKSASIEGPWETEISGAPACGDCPCPFEWNGWHYIVQGFCTMARSKTGESGTYTDEVLDGHDIYEGLSVPMVTSWKGNRRLLVGWINHLYGWGGWLCFRELVQEADGRLGTKWVPEIPMPAKPEIRLVSPGKTLTVAFEPEDNGGKPFAFILDSKTCRARFASKAADGTYPEIPTLRDLALEAQPDYGVHRISAGRKYRPDEADDFALMDIRGLNKPFAVRIVNWFDKKSGATLIDVEIAGRRTMVTRRAGRFSMN